MTESFWAQVDKRQREAVAIRPAIQQDPEASALLDLARDGGFLGRNKPRVREIGERVNARGGFTEMQRVAMLLRAGYPHGEQDEDGWGWHPAELGCAWHGIGQWGW